MDDSESLGNSVFYEARLPLTWSILDQEPVLSELEKVAEENEQLLQLLLPERVEPEEKPPQWDYLDAKINLILQWLGRLVIQNNPLPESVAVKFTGREIHWHESKPPPPQQWLMVDVYPRELPKSLRLVGQYFDTGDPAYPGGIKFCHFESVTYDKFIFQHHRRFVAGRKKPL